jgi:hypothetical protein
VLIGLRDLYKGFTSCNPLGDVTCTSQAGISQTVTDRITYQWPASHKVACRPRDNNLFQLSSHCNLTSFLTSCQLKNTMQQAECHILLWLSTPAKSIY